MPHGVGFGAGIQLYHSDVGSAAECAVLYGPHTMAQPPGGQAGLSSWAPQLLCQTATS